MRRSRVVRTALVLAMLSACGPGGAPAGDAGEGDTAPNADVGATPDEATVDVGAPDVGADAAPDAPGRDAGADAGADASAAEAGAPNISEALDCGDGPPNGPGLSNELQRLEVDRAIFPSALCNDGSAPALYFRPYRGEQNRNRWVINLNGGGGCNSGPSCAARWCWCRSMTGPNGCPHAEEVTNFSRGNMVGEGPASLVAQGILMRGTAEMPNPLADFNQVRLVYCSSDGWAGTQRAATLTAPHPKTGASVTYSIHFLGARVLEADLSILRADRVPSPTYTAGGARTVMPDLDDAVEVVLSGDSAGGLGVTSNLDRVAELLRANNTACAGGGRCPLEVRGLIDAAVGPEFSRLDFSMSAGAAEGVTTYARFNELMSANAAAVQGTLRDESCVRWHSANRPGTERECADPTHVLRHHVTTPFFVRMALADQLVLANYVELGLRDPMLGPVIPRVFVQLLQRELSTFSMLQRTAEEGSAMPTAPGVFAPLCTVHDTIHRNEEVYGVTITPAGGRATRLFDVFGPWRSGTAGATSVVAASLTETMCAP